MGTLGKAELELLQQMNADLPDVDWKTGARTYIQQALSDGAFAEYSLTKPFVALTPHSQYSVIPTVLDLFRDFCNVLKLLQLPAGSRVLDVACGGGWLSHYFAKMGYQALGVDICEDLLAMARQRVAEDTRLSIKPEFVLCDLEEETIKASNFRAAIFESCFHHFHNPISVLRHVVDVLDADGVVVLIEGECRQGGLNPQWIEEMNRYHTIERPYTRMEMIEVLRLAGLPCYEFMAPVDGWHSPRRQETYALPVRVAETTRLQNRCVAARTPDALRRILPWWNPPSTVRFCEGFTAGVANKRWCAPYGRILVRAVTEPVRP